MLGLLKPSSELGIGQHVEKLYLLPVGHALEFPAALSLAFSQNLGHKQFGFCWLTLS